MLALPRQLFRSPKGSLDVLESIIGSAFTHERPIFCIAGSSEFKKLNLRHKRAAIHSDIISTNRFLSWYLMAEVLSGEYDDGIFCMMALHVAHRHSDPRRDNIVHNPLSGPQNRENWRELLLEAYDGENPGRHILDALNAGTLVFGESLNHRNEPVKVYVEFLRKMRVLAASDETINEPLLTSLANLVTKIGCTSPSKPGLTELIVEILRTMKPSAASQSHIQDSVSESFWHGLEHIVQAATAAKYEEKEKLEGLIFDTLDLETRSPISTSRHAARIKNHPRIATWLAPKIGGTSSPPYGGQWLKLMNKFEAEWFDFGTSYQQLWAECHLGSRLTEYFRHVSRAEQLHLISPILLRVIRFETRRARQGLVEDLVSTSAKTMTNICKSRERFGGSWRRDVYLVVEILFQVWEFFERDGANDGTNRTMVRAFEGILNTLESSLPQEEQHGTGFHGQLLHFTEYIQQRRGIPALISHNFDVTLNRLYAKSDQKVEWGYQSYGQPRVPSCVIRDFVNDGML
ncbi:hypothetical protein FRC00_005464 [Tulasnella sp. 408]|nr:hypothetical protein FRC00_005464 [Tulasnella sp. 408]